MPASLYRPDPQTLLKLVERLLEQTEARQLTWNVAGDECLVARWVGYRVSLERKPATFPEFEFNVTLTPTVGQAIRFTHAGELLRKLWDLAADGRSCVEFDAVLSEAAKSLENLGKE